MQEEGLIVMQIEGADKTKPPREQGQAVQDPNFSQVWILLNAKSQAARFSVPAGEVFWPRKTGQLIYTNVSCSLTYVMPASSR